MRTNTTQVLLVEDNPADARLLQVILTEANGSGEGFNLQHVERISEALTSLSREHYDAILLDLTLPDGQGLTTAEVLCAAAPEVPIVVLTGLDDEAMALQAVQAGAQDYLVKGQVDGPMLTRALRYAIERHRMQQELRAMSLMDELTGLYNRRGFTPSSRRGWVTLGEQQLRVSRRVDRGMFLLLSDLDGLKSINDTYGHVSGDQALAEAGAVLSETFRGSDIIARLGGDEFAVLATESDPPAPDEILQRLETNTQARNARGDLAYNLKLSSGIVRYAPDSKLSLDDLIAQADARMYEQKRKNKVIRE